MDVSKAIIAKSDQLNSSDLIGGEQTVTIIEVVQGNAEQPVNIVTDVFGNGRPFKPSKTVLRILAGAWGTDTTAWVGRRMTVYRDPSVKWAGEEIGGIRVNALSDIDKPLPFNLPTSKGKHAKTVVQPLPAATPVDWAGRISSAATLAELQAVWQEATAAGATRDPKLVAAKDARKAELADGEAHV